MPEYFSPLWLLLVPFCAAGAIWCFRYSIPLILCAEDNPAASKLDAYLPLKGRWLRGGIGAVVLFVGISLALVGGMIAFFEGLLLFRWSVITP